MLLMLIMSVDVVAAVVVVVVFVVKTNCVKNVIRPSFTSLRDGLLKSFATTSEGSRKICKTISKYVKLLHTKGAVLIACTYFKGIVLV